MRLIAPPPIVVAIRVAESEGHETLLERRDPPGVVRRREVEQRDSREKARRREERLRDAERVARAIRPELPAPHRLDVRVIEVAMIEDGPGKTQRRCESVNRAEPVFAVGGGR